jgi:heat shock protein HtpX
VIYDAYLALSSLSVLWYWLFTSLDVRLAILTVVRNLSPPILTIFAYFTSERRIRDSLQAPLISHPICHAIFDECLTILEISKKTELWIVDSDSFDIFAFGTRKSGTVAITRGLVERLSPDELKGVLSHELTHIKNGDHSVMMWTNALVNVYKSFLPIYLASSLLSIILQLDLEVGNPVRVTVSTFTNLFMVFVIPTLLVNSYSRTREYAADRAAFSVTKAYQQALTKARRLRFVSIAGNERLSLLPSSESKHLSALFRTHPPFRDRISSLSRDSLPRTSLFGCVTIGVVAAVSTLLMVDAIPSCVLFLMAQIPSFYPPSAQIAVRVSLALTLARSLEPMIYLLELVIPAATLSLLIPSHEGTEQRQVLRNLLQGLACAAGLSAASAFFLLPEQGVSLNGVFPVPLKLWPLTEESRSFLSLLYASLRYSVVLSLLSFVGWVVVPAAKTYLVSRDRKS